MVHVRLNQAEPNPNHHINFITALPTNPEQQEEARQLLRALAAQVRPVMKSHGFAVNSLEEVHTLTLLSLYSECRLWCHSMSTIKCSQGGTGMLERPLVNLALVLWSKRLLHVFLLELVLRRPGGSFYPAYWLMSTLCHEVYGPVHIGFSNRAYTLNSSWPTSRWVILMRMKLHFLNTT